MKLFFCLALIPLFILNPAYVDRSVRDATDAITWYSMEEAQRLAAENDKKVLVYAMAEWCGYCKKMEREVYPNQAVVKTLHTYYYPVKLNIESDKSITFNGDKMTEQQFAFKYRVTGTPTFFFLDAEGEMLGAQPGYIPIDTFTKLLTYVGTDTYMKIRFEEYLEEGK